MKTGRHCITKRPFLGHAGRDSRCCQSKWLILVELLVIILIFLADAVHWIPVSKTPLLLAFAWLSLRLTSALPTISDKCSHGYLMIRGIGALV